MITLDIPRIARLKGVQRPYSFLTSNGFSHHTAKKLIAGTMKRLHFSDLEKLCRIFRCEPHDLYDYRPAQAVAIAGNDHLAFLTKDKGVADLHALARRLSAKDMEAFIREANDRFKAA
ncbi:MAG: helix-turn-helix transcriptional regulator [Flavobacteriales bacterium]|nr:helix-turn-helix transcriptional regulator [Flavobacteriales bacterium]MCC6938268.1 helix-turn-helix transcriptional regulator [Flavobacteriales bacterium]